MSGTILISVVSTLIAGALLFSGLAVGSASTWLTLIPVVLLGLLATLPIGAVLGSLFPSARSAGLLTLAMGGLAAISGIFPLCWLGLGTRSALLPANLGLGGDRSFLAAPGHLRRAERMGRRRAPGGADSAALGGAARVRVERGCAPREGPAAGSRVRRHHE